MAVYVTGVLDRDVESEIEMARRVLDGETMQSIADDYGITKERVRQLVKRHGVTGEDGRAARMVEWVCGACGTSEFRTLWEAKRTRACSRGCAGVMTRGPRSAAETRIMPDGRSANRHPSGHWQVNIGRGRNIRRAERHIAQLHLGRDLRRNEWVVLIDGNPDNLDPTNIGICTPRDVMARRDGRPWSYTPIPKLVATE